MPAIERVIPLVGQLPAAIREALARRLRELAGLSLVALSGVAAAALMTLSRLAVDRADWSLATLLAVFAVIAFLLAASGIYGVVAYDVSRRTSEIGIRISLGAQPRDVLRLILGQCARLAALGIALGLAGAFALTRLMESMLFGVKPTDAYTFAVISLLLACVALAAGYLPSRRAMALHPAAALRHE